MDRSDLQSAAERFDLLDHAPIGQLILRQDFFVLFWNRCLEAWTGIPRSHIIGTSLLDRFPHLDAAKYKNRIESIFHGGPPTIFSSQLHKYVIPAPLPDGTFRFQYTVVTSIPAAEKGCYAMFAIQDVTSLTEALEGQRRVHKKVLEEMEERKKAQAELTKHAETLQKLNAILQEQAIRDGLTGLFNHNYFYQVLHRDFMLAHRHGTDIACLLLDLDHFKLINDTYGHPCGDAVLREVATLVKDQVRSTDLVARYGGEEFAVLLPHTSLAGAKVLAEQIRTSVASHPFHAETETFRITTSIGAASLQAHRPELPRDLLALADRALYQAKAAGRNRLLEYSPAPQTSPSPQPPSP